MKSERNPILKSFAGVRKCNIFKTKDIYTIFDSNPSIRRKTVSRVKVTEWPPTGKIAARLRYVSWYKCLIVSLVFSHLGFWRGNLFLIAPFPDHCLLVPFPNLVDFSFPWVPKTIMVIHTVKNEKRRKRSIGSCR